MKESRVQTARIVNEKGRLMVSGDLNFFTVNALWKESVPLLLSCKELEIDLSEVNSSNSAGLALLIEWQKCATQQKKQITFSHIPNQLQAVFSAAGIEGLFA